MNLNVSTYDTCLQYVNLDLVQSVFELFRVLYGEVHRKLSCFYELTNNITRVVQARKEKLK